MDMDIYFWRISNFIAYLYLFIDTFPFQCYVRTIFCFDIQIRIGISFQVLFGNSISIYLIITKEDISRIPKNSFIFKSVYVQTSLP